MARPQHKDDLVLQAEGEYNKLMTLIDSLSEEDLQANFTFEDRDKNVRDVLAHLHEWHNMMNTWYQDGMVEKKQPAIPAPGYTWRTTPTLNLKIWEKYQDTDLDTIRKKLEASHNHMMFYIKAHTNEELFQKSVYSWTKTNALGAYFIGSTSSHYNWAQKKIRKHKKERSKQLNL